MYELWILPWCYSEGRNVAKSLIRVDSLKTLFDTFIEYLHAFSTIFKKLTKIYYDKDWDYFVELIY